MVSDPDLFNTHGLGKGDHALVAVRLLRDHFSAERLVIDESVDEVILPSVEGYMGVRPGHAPLLAETSGETLRYADDTGTHSVDLPAGMLQVRGNEVLILVGGVLQPSNEDGERFERLTGALLETFASVQ